MLASVLHKTIPLSAIQNSGGVRTDYALAHDASLSLLRLHMHKVCTITYIYTDFTTVDNAHSATILHIKTDAKKHSGTDL